MHAVYKMQWLQYAKMKSFWTLLLKANKDRLLMKITRIFPIYTCKIRIKTKLRKLKKKEYEKLKFTKTFKKQNKYNWIIIIIKLCQ